MACRLQGCTTMAAHGHWMVDEGCSECQAYALKTPELVGQPTPPRPYHHTICGKHGLGESELCPACDEKLRGVIEGHDKEPEVGFSTQAVKPPVAPKPVKKPRKVKKPQPSMSRRKK